jgi:hypothetical protein
MIRRCEGFVTASCRTAGSAVLLFAAGCGSSGIVPPGDSAAARETLAHVLDSWRTGRTPEELRSAEPVVYAADPDWSAGRKLSKYEIAGEPVQNGGEWRVFASLTLAGGGASKVSQKVCYSVSPGDPANVSRSDYLY